MPTIIEHPSSIHYVTGKAPQVEDLFLHVIDDDQTLSLTPAPINKSIFWGVMLSVFGIILTASVWIYLVSGFNENQYAVWIFGLFLALLPGSYYFRKWQQFRLGPWLIYEKQDSALILPRENRLFQSKEIARLQIVQGRSKGRESVADKYNPIVIEFVVVAEVDGQTSTHPLFMLGQMRDSANLFVDKLIGQTDLPVYHYRQIGKSVNAQFEVIDMRAETLDS